MVSLTSIVPSGRSVTPDLSWTISPLTIFAMKSPLPTLKSMPQRVEVSHQMPKSLSSLT